MSDKSYGQMLLEDTLPSDISIEGPVTKKILKGHMRSLAKRDPKLYVSTVQKLKAFGDEVATLEGISVGLDDIAPDYAKRDPVLKEALRQMKAATSDVEKRRILMQAQKDMVTATKNHPSDMTIMAKSGGRGSIAQLMKIVASPVVAMDRGRPAPWLVTKSYSQGVNPADSWVTGVEARRNAIASSGSVVEPGMVAKVVMNNMDDLVVTVADCDTKGGILLSTKDQIVDRYLARSEGRYPRNTLVTGEVAASLRKSGKRKVLVRSGATCDAQNGVCQKCVGLNEWGRPATIGTNVGARSAQAMTEPLTQFALNAKHGVRLADDGSGSPELVGLTGFRTLTEVPKSFMEKASIAEEDGRIDGVKKAPQGGWHVTLNGRSYYTPPGLKPIVKVGDIVEAGDALTSGVAMPDAVVTHKGVGAGRIHLSNQLTNLYRKQGVDIDRRHTELLARNAMRHVRIDADPTNKFLRGDIVPYSDVQKQMSRQSKSVTCAQAKDKILAKPVLHYSAGTRVTPTVLRELKSAGVTSVDVSTTPTEFTPIMRSMIQAPLLNDDWMSRLSHRYLKRTLVEGAGFGSTTDLESTSPVPAYVAGAPFGTGSEGKYAGLRKMLFGDAANAARRFADRGPEAIRLVSDAPYRAGGVDSAALGVKRMQSRLPEGFLSRTGLLQDNRVSERGIKFTEALRELDDGPDGVFAQMHQKAPVRMPNEPARDYIARANAYQSHMAEVRPKWEEAVAKLRAIDPEAAKEWTPEVAQRFAQTKPTKLQAGGRFLGDFALGEQPLSIMRERYEMGGLLGRGGLLRGEMAIDPDVVRAWNRARDPNDAGKYRDVVVPALGDAMNKGLAFAAPAYVAHEAATSTPAPGESRGESIGGTLGDALGWTIGSPLGMLTGGAFAAPFTIAGKAIGRHFDPVAPRPAQQAQHPQRPQNSGVRPAAAAAGMGAMGGAYRPLLRAGDEGADALMQSMQSHKYFARLNAAQDAFGHAQERWDELEPHMKKMLEERLRSKPAAPAKSAPGASNFSPHPGVRPALEHSRLRSQAKNPTTGIAPGGWNK